MPNAFSRFNLLMHALNISLEMTIGLVLPVGSTISLAVVGFKG